MLLGLLTLLCSTMISPDRRASCDFQFRDGRAVFAVSCDRRCAATLSAGENWQSAACTQVATTHTNRWKTVWGDRAEVRDAYAQAFFACRDAAGRVVEIETRLYDEGFAFRYRLPDGGVFVEKTDVAYPSDARAWAIAKTEDTYPRDPIPLARRSPVDKEWMTPLTVVSAAGYSSFFEAYAARYPRMRVVPREGGVAVKLLQSDAPVLKSGATTPWRALQLASTPAELVDRSTLVLNLNPPCALSDTRWIKPGLTLSNLSNCRLVTEDIVAMARAEQPSGVRYVQLDWGWYGTEWAWSAADREKFVRTNPSMRDESTWRDNTLGNARRTAKGIVPYLPGWQRQFAVDLDFPTLLPALKQLDVGLCLYVRGAVLEQENLESLFALYQSWGVAGVKPGFVRYGSAADTDWNRALVETAARHRLWVDIHDADIPDGMQRTYPNLFQMEGVGGEEGRHPVHQDLVIPFARGLVGPFDYTPMVFTAGRSQAHVLAMLLCYSGPTAVVRGQGLVRDRLANGTSCWGWGSARSFVRQLPWKYDESRTLDAAVGRRLVTARRAGRVWFLAGMSGAGMEAVRIPCDFLAVDVPYRLTLWTDDLRDAAECRRMIETKRLVARHDALSLDLAPAGGFLALLQPVDARVDEQRFAPSLRMEGADDLVTTQATRTVTIHANALEVMFFRNGRFYGAQVPDSRQTCVWPNVPLDPGENVFVFKAGQITRRFTIFRRQ